MSNRCFRLRWLSCPPAVALLLAGCSTEVVVAEQVVAKELLIVGADDAPRVFVGTSDQGNGMLIYDAKGKIRAGLNLLADDRSELVLGDREGKLRVVISHKGDTSVVVLCDAQGQARARTRIGPEGAQLELLDAEGKVVARQPQ
jgi:hypothetical protein